MNNDFANVMIILGSIWTIGVLLLGKRMYKKAKLILLFFGGFCYGVAVAIYVL